MVKDHVNKPVVVELIIQVGKLQVGFVIEIVNEDYYKNEQREQVVNVNV